MFGAIIQCENPNKYNCIHACKQEWRRARNSMSMPPPRTTAASVQAWMQVSPAATCPYPVVSLSSLCSEISHHIAGAYRFQTSMHVLYPPDAIGGSGSQLQLMQSLGFAGKPGGGDSGAGGGGRGRGGRTGWKWCRRIKAGLRTWLRWSARLSSALSPSTRSTKYFSCQHVLYTIVMSSEM